MRGRTLAILVLVVAAVAAFVWFVERDLPTTEEREETEDRLLALEAEEVVRLELVFDDRRVVLEREAPATGSEESATPREWRLVEPLAARADGGAVGSLVRRLVELDAVRTLDGIEDPATYGLDPPRLTVILTADDESVTLRVGESLPASGQRLVALDAAPPYHLVEGSVFETAVQDPGEWRDPDLFPWGRRDVERVRLGAGDESVLLARRGDEFWIEAPFADAADPERVDRLLAALTDLRAEEFLDDAAAVPGGDRASATLEVTLRDRQEPVRIVVAAPPEDGSGPGETATPADAVEAVEAEGPAEATELPAPATVRVDEQWTRVETELPGLAGGAAESWRSPRLTAWPVYDIDTISVEGEDGELLLTRDGVDWRRGEEKILYSTVGGLLSAVTGFRAAAVEPRAKAADSEPAALTLSVTHKEGARETFRVRWVDDEVVLLPEGRSVVLRAPAETWSPIEEALAAVRGAEPLPEEPEEGEGPGETGDVE